MELGPWTLGAGPAGRVRLGRERLSILFQLARIEHNLTVYNLNQGPNQHVVDIVPPSWRCPANSTSQTCQSRYSSSGLNLLKPDNCSTQNSLQAWIFSTNGRSHKYQRRAQEFLTTYSSPVGRRASRRWFKNPDLWETRELSPVMF